MISSALKNWQQSRRYRIDGDTVYGVCNGVGFSVVEEDGGRLAVMMLSGADSAFDSIEDMLLDENGELHDVQVGDVENYLALFYDESRGTMPDTVLDELLEFVAANFRTCGFKAPNKCVVCGAPANKRSFRNGMVQPMCADCREAEKTEKRGGSQSKQRSHSQQDDAPYGEQPITPRKSSYDDSYDEYGDAAMQEETHRKTAAMFDNSDFGKPAARPMQDVMFDASDDYDYNYRPDGSSGGGTLGALLGSIGGLIPFFLSVMAGLPVAALCFVSGICAAWGYTSYAGLRTKSASVKNVIIMSEIMSVIGVFVAYILGQVADYGSFAAASPHLWDGVTELVINLVLAIIGALLGVAVSSGRLNKYINGEI